MQGEDSDICAGSSPRHRQVCMPTNGSQHLATHLLSVGDLPPPSCLVLLSTETHREAPCCPWIYKDFQGPATLAGVSALSTGQKCPLFLHNRAQQHVCVHSSVCLCAHANVGVFECVHLHAGAYLGMCLGIEMTVMC